MSDLIQSISEPSVMGDIRAKITDIKDRIKSEGLSTTIFGELTNSANMLQTKLDELLQKKGLYTQSDINDAYSVLKEAKRKELELMSMQSKRKVIMFTLLIVGASIGAYIYFKRKKQ